MNSKIIYLTEGIDVVDKMYGISEEERAVIEVMRGKVSEEDI